MVALRFDVVLVILDPTVGAEMQKTRPCLIVSPDPMNRHLQTLIVAPLISRSHKYPFRVACRFQGKRGEVALDQLRTIARERIVRRLGTISATVQAQTLQVLKKLFAP